MGRLVTWSFAKLFGVFLYVVVTAYLVHKLFGWRLLPAAPFLAIGLYLLLLGVLESPRLAFCLRLLLLTRMSLLMGALLPGLVVLAWVGNPDLLQGAFVVDDGYQLFHVTWLSMLTAAAVLVTFRTTQLNAARRFPEYAAAENAAGITFPSHATWRFRWLALLGLGLAIPGACLYWTVQDLHQVSGVPEATPWSSAWPFTAALVLGVLATILVLALLCALQELSLDPRVLSPGLLPFESWFSGLKNYNGLARLLTPPGRWLGQLLARFGPGYAPERGDDGYLLPGHAQNLLCAVVTFLAYLGGYFLGFPDNQSLFPAPFFILMPILLLTFFLPALAFWLDYYRFPVLLALLAVTMALYVHTDHYYEIHAGDPLTLADWPNLTTVFDNRKQGEFRLPGANSKRTLVVVTASGGGIQATAWTVQVLTGLHQRYGQDFDRSVGLISAVSGGSVGTMYYLALGDWQAGGDPFPRADRLENLRTRSQESSLEATAWGLAYPDTMRVWTPFPYIEFDRRVDRGWAIEQSWGRRLSWDNESRVSDLRLRDWARPIREGRMPVVVFNTTLVETGQRLLISPVVANPAEPENATEAREFLELFQDDRPNPRVTTAVRLSATFPYVSPIARAYRDHQSTGSEKKRDYHVADGGYIDNEGMFTAANWIYQLLKYYREKPADQRPFDRILVVRILPFPVPSASDAKPPQEDAGWFYEGLGPIQALQNVRSASQAERNTLNIDFLSTAMGWLHQKDPEVITVDQAIFMFPSHDQDGKPIIDGIPLSWKLTAVQKQRIGKAWEGILHDPEAKVPGRERKPITILDTYFTPLESVNP